MARGAASLPAAWVNYYGTGCPPAAPLTLTSGLPVIGTTWQLLAQNVPSGIAVFVFGSDAYANGISLDFIGALGCFAYTNANIHTLIGTPIAPGSTTTFGCPCPIPTNPALAGFEVYSQAAAPAGNLAGFTTSNGLHASVGY